MIKTLLNEKEYEEYLELRKAVDALVKTVNCYSVSRHTNYSMMTNMGTNFIITHQELNSKFSNKEESLVEQHFVNCLNTKNMEKCDVLYSNSIFNIRVKRNHGNLVRYSKYLIRSGNIASDLKQKFDENDRLIESIKHDYDNSIDEFSTITCKYSYNTKGELFKYIKIKTRTENGKTDHLYTDERVRVFETINGVEFNKFKNNISDEIMYTYILGKDKHVCSEKPNQIILKYKTDRGISIDERYNLNIDVMNICNQYM